MQARAGSYSLDRTAVTVIGTRRYPGVSRVTHIVRASIGRRPAQLTAPIVEKCPSTGSGRTVASYGVSRLRSTRTGAVRDNGHVHTCHSI